MGVKMQYVRAEADYGTAGSVRNATKGMNERILIISGDVLTDFDLGKLLSRHAEAGAEGTIHLTPVEDPSRYGVVPTDDVHHAVQRAAGVGIGVAEHGVERGATETERLGE